MSRTATPKKTKDAVLSEFNHRCALCGSDRPHLHHIDENPTNHEVLNLLPLCPNCHLRDQHNPTSAIELGKLKLFREHKDPAILLPQFHPIFVRMKFLDAVEVNEDSIEALVAQATELVELVEALEMGQFYGKRLTELLRRMNPMSFWNVNGRDEEADRHFRKESLEYREGLIRNRSAVKSLIVELLRYQNWANAA